MIPKFRAWDKYHEIMVIIISIDFERKIAYVGREDGDRWEIHFDNLNFMQSTRLKDKNGVEIYEGDLVQNGRGEIGYVTYLLQETGFVVVLKNTDYRLGHRNTGESYDMAYWHEIIGNIYENPELLEAIE
ncbi:YopX family protein [Enterococcus avium]|uniref:YopX family protein n=1 Tax=Enterococcus avium TaxID=33945 RepID=UPI001F5A9AE2|nr:YopX family protein [Enterococcus avium]